MSAEDILWYWKWYSSSVLYSFTTPFMMSSSMLEDVKDAAKSVSEVLCRNIPCVEYKDDEKIINIHSFCLFIPRDFPQVVRNFLRDATTKLLEKFWCNIEQLYEFTLLQRIMLWYALYLVRKGNYKALPSNILFLISEKLNLIHDEREVEYSTYFPVVRLFGTPEEAYVTVHIHTAYKTNRCIFVTGSMEKDDKSYRFIHTIPLGYYWERIFSSKRVDKQLVGELVMSYPASRYLETLARVILLPDYMFGDGPMSVDGVIYKFLRHTALRMITVFDKVTPCIAFDYEHITELLALIPFLQKYFSTIVGSGGSSSTVGFLPTTYCREIKEFLMKSSIVMFISQTFEDLYRWATHTIGLMKKYMDEKYFVGDVHALACAKFFRLDVC